MLRALSLTKTYGRRVVVRDVCLEIRQGEVVGLLGGERRNLLGEELEDVVERLVTERLHHEPGRPDVGEHVDGVGANGASGRPSLSKDARQVAFESTATNLTRPQALTPPDPRASSPTTYVVDLRGGGPVTSRWLVGRRGPGARAACAARWG